MQHDCTRQKDDPLSKRGLALKACGISWGYPLGDIPGGSPEGTPQGVPRVILQGFTFRILFKTYPKIDPNHDPKSMGIYGNP